MRHLLLLLFVASLATGCRTANRWFGDTDLRPPKAGRTLVFCRGQMKYGLNETYLDRWTDRPLFQDSALRTDKQKWVMGQPSYDRMVRIAAAYEIDGFAFLGETSGRIGIFDLTEASGIGPSFKLLPELVSWKDIEPKQAMLERALASPHTATLAGRIPITSYRADALPLETWADYLATFRQQYGADAFIFLPDLTGKLTGFKDRYHAGDAIPAAEIEELKATLRAWAKVWDGLYIAGSAAMKKDRLFDEQFYGDFVIPAIQSVMAEPGMEDKYWGLSAGIGHENCTRLGYTLSHDGTKTLRHSLETALNARPDLLVLPEWDEQNENTSIRPTVYNGTTTQRLVRHYMQRLKGETPSPLPGDATDLPNLLISYRKILTLGEELQIELVNVPDGTLDQAYTVQVDLFSASQRVYRSDPIPFKGQRLTEHTLRLPSEDLAPYPALRPRLTIRHGEHQWVLQDGLHPMRLRATWNWDYKWVKAAIRDVVQPEHATLQWEPQPDGLVRVRGDLAFPEPIASVEILDEDQVVFAVSPTGDSPRERTDVALFAFEARAYNRHTMAGSVTAPGTWHPNWAFTGQQRGDTLTFSQRLDWARRMAFCEVPIDALPSATLALETDVAQLDVPLKPLNDLEIWSRTIDDQTFTVSRYWLQPDHPRHLNRLAASFEALVKPALTRSMLHLRVVTESGRIYRSSPFLAGKPSGATQPIAIWSDTHDKPVRLAMDAARVPDLDYRFETDRGSVFWVDDMRLLRGHLGGYTDSITGRGGDGGLDGSPFLRRTNYPAGVTDLAPDWVTKDGQTALRFDGIGNYVSLPQGVLPRRSGYTLSMELKPDAVDKPQVLFIHHGNYIGSLTVRLQGGKVHLSHVSDKLEHVHYDTGLTMRPGVWQKLEISWDCANLRARLAGTEAGPFPAPRPGLYDTTSVLGGFGGEPGKDQDFVGNVGWFAGWIRAFRVAHRLF